MAHKDLKEFIDRLRREGKLKEIREEVSPDLEIAALLDREG